MSEEKFIENALSQLDVTYKKYPYKYGSIYFCSSHDNITFDLLLSDKQAIKIWRYICFDTIVYPFSDKVYYSFNNIDSEIGMESTDEGDISLYANQTINDDKSKKKVFKTDESLH